MHNAKKSRKFMDLMVLLAILGLAFASMLIEGLETKLILAAACLVTLRELIRQIIKK